MDIAAPGFDAGIRPAESVPRDMVAVPLSADLRMVVAGSPTYLAEHGVPQSPADLATHQAIRMRLSPAASITGSWSAAARAGPSACRAG